MASAVLWYSELRKLVVRFLGRFVRRPLRASIDAPQPVQR
jgi:hypothetical protein